MSNGSKSAKGRSSKRAQRLLPSRAREATSPKPKRQRKRAHERPAAPGLHSMSADDVKQLFANVRDGAIIPHRRPNYARDAKTRAEQQAAFLTTLSQTGNVRCACEAAGVSRASAYEWREADETFKALWKAALENAIDLLEEEAWRRGYHGVDKPIVYKGRVTSTYKEYSDRMLEILLKAHRKKFRDKVELTGEDGGPISTVTRVERVIVRPEKK